ncbi:hypothetical protein ACEUD2_05780 [Aeromonas veronii]
MVLVNDLKKIKILPIGSCRIYRPFLKAKNQVLINNTFQEVEVIYPQFGFFHSIAEITQVIKMVAFGLSSLEMEYKEFLFRKEPASTTPLNIFNESIWIDGIFDAQLGNQLRDIDYLLIEVSSLSYFKVRNSDIYLHWNPNFEKNCSYSDIYPEGYYKNNSFRCEVDKLDCDLNFIKCCLGDILDILPKVKVVLTGHINDEQSVTRKKLNEMLFEASEDFERVVFFDNKNIFNKFGYNLLNGKNDVHHLSDLGEHQLGISLQNLVLSYEC